MRIAIGSIGLTISNFKTLLEARPDFYKIDRTLVSGVNKWTSSQDAIESIAMLALRRGGRAIAVGVQTPEELQTIHALGVELVQGFYFGEPWAAERLLRPTIEKKEGH
jgi:EAL domain-containing protein (putative c-di-GMP-specific phosphodiesterase class I)